MSAGHALEEADCNSCATGGAGEIVSIFGEQAIAKNKSVEITVTGRFIDDSITTGRILATRK
jgi:hypothetical protein